MDLWGLCGFTLSGDRTKRVNNIYNGRRPMKYIHDIGVQMKRKELTKTFMMISIGKKSLSSPWFAYKYFSTLIPLTSQQTQDLMVF